MKNSFFFFFVKMVSVWRLLINYLLAYKVQLYLCHVFKISNIIIQPPNTTNETAGFDLLSYDIQRSRDTGLPPYNKMRILCGLSPAKSFDDLSEHMPTEVNILNANFAIHVEKKA